MKNCIQQAILYILGVGLFLNAHGQSAYLTSGHEWHDFANRMEIKAGGSAPMFHSALKPFELKALIDFLIHTDTTSLKLSRTDRGIIHSILLQNPEWSIKDTLANQHASLKYFYRKPAHFLLFHDDEFFLSINPVIHWEAGWETGFDQAIYLNTRGIEARGMINNKVGFYSFVTDNQARFPSYVNRQIQLQQGAIPGEGWNIPFGNRGYDFFTARGYIAFQATRNIGFQFGQDRNAIGYGQRSLFLSDYANNYLFLKINTHIWRFHYQNIFARLVDFPLRSHGGRLFDPKYMVAHTLSINLSPRFQLGFFENVVFGRADAVSRRGFDPHYLNPVIFYRAVEHHIGDPDKVALGFMWRYIAGRSVALHGQVYIDDFLLSDVRNDMDSLWVRLGLRKERKYTDYASFLNKFALQLGIQYVDVLGISNLDLSLEGNWVRPFTYSHYDVSGSGLPPAASYSHYHQALAHPLGANFRELLGTLQYQPHRNWMIKSTIMSFRQGLSSPGNNMGSNIFDDYTTRSRDYGHIFLQGDPNNVLLLQNELSWQWYPGMWLDVRYIRRNSGFQNTVDKTGTFTAALRINAGKRNFWF